MLKSISLLLTSGVLLAACGPISPAAPTNPTTPAPTPAPVTTPAPVAPKKPQGELVEAIINNPVQFNPILTSDRIGRDITARIFTGLVKLGPKVEVLPDVATKWTASANGLEWTMTLRSDVKFHDGKPLTAADVAYTYNAIRDPGYTGTLKSTFAALTKVDVIDSTTVKFTLKEPFAPFLSSLTVGILPKHLFEGQTVAAMKDNPLNRKPVGNGPWVFKEWKDGQYIILEANSDYYEGAPGLERIRYKFLPDTNVATAEFEAGQVDYFIPGTKDIDRLKQTMGSKIKTVQATPLTFIALYFNFDRFGMNELPVRQAFAHAVNRQQIVDLALGGQGFVVHTDTPQASDWYNPKIPTYDYNPAKAKQILEGAGFKLGSDGIYAKDGKRLSYTVMHSAGLAVRETTAQILQANLKEVGIALEPLALETSVFLNKHIWMGDYDLQINGFTVSTDPDMYPRYHSSQAVKDATGRFVGFNRGMYINSEADKLMVDGRLESDPAKRRVIYDRLQVILAQELPALFLYSQTETHMIKSQFSGMVEGYTGFMFSHKWELKK